MTDKQREEENRIYYLRKYNESLEWITNKVKEKVEEMKDILEEVRIQPLEEFLEKKPSYLPNFTAWSKKFVYVAGMYDGDIWIAVISRNPSDFLCKTIGGG